MPTYEYQCRTCGHRFELMQSMSADVLSTCPTNECTLDDERKGTGEVFRRVSGGAGLVFKGEGFYLTDYVRKGKEGGDPASTSKGSKADTATSGATKSDSGESKGGESRSSESRGGESKSSESKGGESKGGDSKTSDSKSGAKSGSSGETSSKGSSSSESSSSNKGSSGESSGSKSN
ncbi:MAG: FmdB family transcriptional regulator [bacterium]|nr:FmdB family transcriptional regulator [Candidatus Kapabacteria bacterium]